jgi:hypothetical protein
MGVDDWGCEASKSAATRCSDWVSLNHEVELVQSISTNHQGGRGTWDSLWGLVPDQLGGQDPTQTETGFASMGA